MDYDFGDILDARKAPGRGHFLLVVGEATKGGETEVMYYTITSRVYTVFKNILLYFNDCLTRSDRHFLRHYGKEKGKGMITPYGLLSQAVFLDKETNYSMCLEVESMVVINSDPSLIDKTALEALRTSHGVVCKTRLVKLDALNLIQTIKCSNNVSPDRVNKIAQSFNRIKASLV
jgi:hypothetical protein